MVVIFFAGIFAAHYIAKTPRLVKGVLDVVPTLPLVVLPPTVVGYLLLRLFGPKRLIGLWFLETFDLRLVMTRWSAIFATVAVAFPLMYRTARGAFESFDEAVADAGRTLGLPNCYIFWRIKLPCCKQGILAGPALAFARALGEYGATSMIAGYTPGRTAAISTTVSALAHRRRCAGAEMGTGQYRYLCCGTSVHQSPRTRKKRKGDSINGLACANSQALGKLPAGCALLNRVREARPAGHIGLS